MECQECQKLISAYVDEMVSPQEKEQIISHMKKCTICQGEYEALKQIKQMCEQIEEVELPNGFHGELMKKVKEEARAKKVVPMKRHWKWQYGGALVATVLVGGLFMNQLGMVGNPLENATTTGESSEANNEVSIARSVGSPETETVQNNSGKQGREVPPLESTLDGTTNSETSDQKTWSVCVTDRASFEKELETYLNHSEMVFEKTQSGYEIEVTSPGELEEWLRQYSLAEEMQQDEDNNGQSPVKIELIIETK